MRKIILKDILISAVISLLLTAVLSFVMQFTVQRSEAQDTADVRISDAKVKIEENEADIAELKASLDAEYISAANSFAEMIKINPRILENSDELARICQILNVDELHVTDEKGVIRWGTITGYFGFDFATSDQTKPFLPILQDPSLEMAQEPQPNGTEGKLFQYISVGRQDTVGIVQVGLEPTRLTEALADSQIDVVLGEISVGINGTMFAVNKSDNTIAAFYDKNFIGTDAAEAGITEKILALGEGKNRITRINGAMFHVTVSETDDYYLGTLIPVSEVITGSVASTAIALLLTAIAITLLAFNVNKAVKIHIINEMEEVCRNINEISAGNTELRVNVRNCDEFSVLSDGINAMLESINAEIAETGKLNASMENLLGRIGTISSTINNHSEEMQDVSKKISDGSSSQAATVEELSAAFTSITHDVNENAAAANNAAMITVETERQLRTSTEKIKEMQESMSQISAASNKINNIVKTIDDIAFQTNILALNAAVEAARAGQHGKGFAVVADEVRNLANKSAEAAKGTTKLIEESLTAVEQGTQVADAAAEELTAMLESVMSSTKLINEISEATTKQAKAINEVTQGMSQISDVVQENSRISFSARETADKLDVEAAKLMSMVSSK